jgi:hypothetical protein
MVDELNDEQRDLLEGYDKKQKPITLRGEWCCINLYAHTNSAICTDSGVGMCIKIYATNGRFLGQGLSLVDQVSGESQKLY